MHLKIIVTKRANDYHACLKSNKAISGSGESSSEAVGNMIIHHEKAFGIKIEVANKN